MVNIMVSNAEKETVWKTCKSTTKTQQNNYILKNILIQDIMLMKRTPPSVKRWEAEIFVLIKCHLSQCLKYYGLKTHLL